MNDSFLSDRSKRNLAGVHPDLVAIVCRAAVMMAERDDGLSFVVTEGLRSTVRQAELVKARASRTMNSRHLTGHAVDLAATVGDQVRWDWPLYDELGRVMKAAAQGVPLVWGGDWKSLRDGPHFELDRLSYP